MGWGGVGWGGEAWGGGETGVACEDDNEEKRINRNLG